VPRLDVAVEILQQIMIQRHPEPDEAFHLHPQVLPN
jgi:hypothetical protein